MGILETKEKLPQIHSENHCEYVAVQYDQVLFTGADIGSDIFRLEQLK